MQNLPLEIIDKIFAYTNPETCIKHSKFHALLNFPEVDMKWAAKRGYLEIVKYFHSIGKDCTTKTMEFAATNGHLEIVKYLHEEVGVECGTYLIEWAVVFGQLEIVKYLHEVVGIECTTKAMDHTVCGEQRGKIRRYFLSL